MVSGCGSVGEAEGGLVSVGVSNCGDGVALAATVGDGKSNVGVIRTVLVAEGNNGCSTLLVGLGKSIGPSTLQADSNKIINISKITLWHLNIIME